MLGLGYRFILVRSAEERRRIINVSRRIYIVLIVLNDEAGAADDGKMNETGWTTTSPQTK